MYKPSDETLENDFSEELRPQLSKRMQVMLKLKMWLVVLFLLFLTNINETCQRQRMIEIVLLFPAG